MRRRLVGGCRCRPSSRHARRLRKVRREEVRGAGCVVRGCSLLRGGTVFCEQIQEWDGGLVCKCNPMGQVRGATVLRPTRPCWLLGSSREHHQLYLKF
jgi:hypothetical protein